MYQHGEGMPIDFTEAARWYRKAADQGNENAQVDLGLLYMGGNGVPKDWDEAARWFRKAADKGNATAQFNLGSLAENGQAGLAQADAAGWYRKSADQGYAYSQAALAGLYSLGHGVPQNKALAFMWMTLASRGMEAGSTRDELAAKITALVAQMTPQEIAEGQRLAKEWKPSGQ